ncbi:penicillin-binding protein 2 [Candidatus Fermentibacteria bacterium]|nr:penicillin-binding protein 2 [Candidatus Fermentibacteria bacterium]
MSQPSPELSPSRRDARIRLAMVLTAALFLVVAARLFKLQVLQHDEYARRADAQHTHTVILDPARGSIFDRNGYLLAGNSPVVTLEVYWPSVPAGSESAIDSLLARIRGAGAEVPVPDRTGVNQIIASDMPWEEALPIISGPVPIGVNWRVGARRTYPLGDDAAQIIGRSTRDCNEGLEREFNSLLTGEPGVCLVERSAYPGMSITSPEASGTPPVDGDDIRLTIDARFQNIVQEELERAAVMSGAEWAAAVLVDPATGDILALGGFPVRAPDGSLLANPCISSIHEPGSTFKIVTLAACLEEGLLTSSDSFDCSAGRIPVADRMISDCHSFGVLSVEQIIAQSSNVGTIQMAGCLADSTLYEYSSRFGFGARTGIELPGEEEGLLHRVSEWSRLSRACLAIGQEVAVTPLQLAMAFCVVANGGNLVRPRLVAASRGTDGWRDWSGIRPRRVISEETAAEIRRILTEAVETGTGASAAVRGVSVAGKTGTAERLGFGAGAYLSAFVGMLPAERPRIVCAVVFDRPDYAYRFVSSLAAPVFSSIMTRLLASDPSIALGVPEEAGGVAVLR